MKKLNTLTLLLIAIIAFSCSSDDSASEQSGFTTHEEKFYSTPHGFIIVPDTTSNGLERIYLSNGTIINDLWDNYNFCHYSDNLTQDVVFSIYDTKISELADGVYTYQLDSFGESDIQYAGFRFGINIYDNCALSYHELATDIGALTTGHITIGVSGNSYKLEYILENTDYDVFVKGNYSGGLKIIQSN